jgi:hypothetical protein
VNLALPLPYEPCASSKSLSSVNLRVEVQGGRRLLQLSLRFGFQAAMGQFLDSEGKDR